MEDAKESGEVLTLVVKGERVVELVDITPQVKHLLAKFEDIIPKEPLDGLPPM